MGGTETGSGFAWRSGTPGNSILTGSSSRGTSELGRRADLLIKLVEKENSDLDGRSRPKSSPRASVTASEKPKKSRSRKRSAPTTEDADAKRMKAVESPASMEA